MTLIEFAHRPELPVAWAVEHPDGTRALHSIDAWPVMPSGSRLTLTEAALRQSAGEVRSPR